MRDDGKKNLNKSFGGGGGKRPPPARHYDPYGKRQATKENTNQKSQITNKAGNKSGSSHQNAGTETHGNKEREQRAQEIREREPEDKEYIEGRNAVIEALRAGMSFDKVFIAKGETDATLKYIAAMARDAGAVVSDVDRRELDSMSYTHAHQGVIAAAANAKYVEVEEIISIARDRGEEPLIVLCDEISDPHNLGAIIRTCEASGVHGVIIPKRRSAGSTATVVKASSGAVFHTAIARVANITTTIKELKKEGIWIFGASSGGDTLMWQTDFTGPSALVIGSEGSGISRLVSENCDFNVKIPMFGKLSSLNASVSAAVLMYEAVRQRRCTDGKR